MSIGLNTILAYGFGLIVLYLIGWLFLAPLKIVLKLIYNSLLGAGILLLINFLGESFNIHIGINPITAIITGILGIPGIILIIILQYIF
jgi:inhibitor of the pro-sigma K processing machinery